MAPSRDAHRTRLRIDKWLWSARFFKTRSIAARACDLGRVQMDGQPVKPARDVRAGRCKQLRATTLRRQGVRGCGGNEC